MQVAVLKETEGKGPYCSLISAVVVVKDVLVFVCFAVNIELAHLVSFRAPLTSPGFLRTAHVRRSMHDLSSLQNPESDNEGRCRR